MKVYNLVLYRENHEMQKVYYIKHAADIITMHETLTRLPLM